MTKITSVIFLIILTAACNSNPEIETTDTETFSQSLNNNHVDVRTERDAFTLNDTYINLDGKNVIFRKDGNVTGFYDYIKYQTLRDHWSNEKQTDRITLIKADSTKDNFALKFNPDNLEFYTLHCISFDTLKSICKETSYDRLVYLLKKK